MNKCFRIILCKSTGKQVVANEKAKAKGKSTVHNNLLKIVSCVALTFSASAMSSMAFAANESCYLYSPQEGGNPFFNSEASFKCLAKFRKF